MMLHAAVLCWLTMLAADCTGHEVLPEGIILMAENPTYAVMLTRPDGSAIYVNPAAIASVTADTTASGGNAIITFANGGKQAVQETVEEIKAIMENRRE